MPDNGPSRRARVMVVEGHKYLQSIMHRLLAVDSTVEIVAELENGVEAVGECRRLAADLILLDLQLPDSNGLAVTRMLKDVLPACRVILLINGPELRSIALESGATDTIVKNRLISDLAATLARNVARGGAQGQGTFVP